MKVVQTGAECSLAGLRLRDRAVADCNIMGTSH